MKRRRVLRRDLDISRLSAWRLERLIDSLRRRLDEVEAEDRQEVEV